MQERRLTGLRSSRDRPWHGEETSRRTFRRTGYAGSRGGNSKEGRKRDVVKYGAWSDVVYFLARDSSLDRHGDTRDRRLTPIRDSYFYPGILRREEPPPPSRIPSTHLDLKLLERGEKPRNLYAVVARVAYAFNPWKIDERCRFIRSSRRHGKDSKKFLLCSYNAYSSNFLSSVFSFNFFSFIYYYFFFLFFFH